MIVADYLITQMRILTSLRRHRQKKIYDQSTITFITLPQQKRSSREGYRMSYQKPEKEFGEGPVCLHSYKTLSKFLSEHSLTFLPQKIHKISKFNSGLLKVSVPGD
jgi:hypothetical protein